MLRRYRRLSLRGSVVFLAVFVAFMAATIVVHAQSPWERAALNLEATFTGPLARSLALVAIVVGGLMFMFGEGGAKSGVRLRRHVRAVKPLHRAPRRGHQSPRHVFWSGEDGHHNPPRQDEPRGSRSRG